MTNAIRGEAALEAGGTRYRLLLTLGALADIEEGLGLSDLAELGPRLKQVRASDIAVITAALCKGGGHDITPAQVQQLPIDLGTLMIAIGLAFERAGIPNTQAETASSPFVGTHSSLSG
jgi:hypothetical protein